MAGGGKTARDNDYYRDFLRRKHPDVFRDLQAGKYKTVAEALKVAGVKKVRTPLQEMLNAWKKATLVEQEAFRLKVCIVGPGLTSAAAATSARPFAVNGRLEPSSVTLIQDVMAKRRMLIGDIMHELGRKRLNPSLGMAMNRGSRLQQDFVDDLEVWLAKQGGSRKIS